MEYYAASESYTAMALMLWKMVLLGPVKKISLNGNLKQNKTKHRKESKRKHPTVNLGDKTSGGIFFVFKPSRMDSYYFYNKTQNKERDKSLLYGSLPDLCPFISHRFRVSSSPIKCPF